MNLGSTENNEWFLKISQSQKSSYILFSRASLVILLVGYHHVSTYFSNFPSIATYIFESIFHYSLKIRQSNIQLAQWKRNVSCKTLSALNLSLNFQKQCILSHVLHRWKPTLRLLPLQRLHCNGICNTYWKFWFFFCEKGNVFM